ncbi:uncharacterized protein HMPREF1541_00985 [Cyphellophora europaea CBS 101466]|uniref:BZIP domain-containing protein n=1 Tax=Cyphellophora europaea (strain CBS 101466) TaxID=1220924 RepID=W2SDI7_CYPE1|nr:uncharacterized protein HMPREF1541_00985 [Cyphellophora europaea CBS 101466]ETN46796.1 hypothetical protein HMPREF1541_00985 [Cyphellophora europaea CBS 101466]
MSGYTNDHFGERTLSALDCIIDDPTGLLYQASPNARLPQATPRDLDILSAEQYPHPLLNRNSHATTKRKQLLTEPPQQLYGGITLRQTALSTESSNDSSLIQTEDPPPRPRKRAKKAPVQQDDSGHEDSTKKSRGRPRLDTQDETAADRRRTQIRLAQRAYRNRKESTIIGLKQRVTDLQNTIERMNATFTDLHDNIIDSGMVNGHRGLSSHLEKVMAQFDELVKNAAADDDDDEPQPTKEPTKKESNFQSKSSKAAHPPISPQQSSQDSDTEELPSTTLSSNDAIYAFDDAAVWPDTSNDVMQFHVHLPEASVSLEEITAKSLTLPELQRPLTPTNPSPVTGGHFYTYSFQETTFARRLQRMCLERAFRGLTSPTISPAHIARTFRFTFCFSNRRRMLNRFQDMLKRRAGEALENFAVPFFQIGGAGTHFPRRDKDGKAVLPPNMLGPERAVETQQFSVGPRRAQVGWDYESGLVETPRGEHSVQELLEKIGFGGLWFDSHDVEGYLETKGIMLDASSSFVEVDPRALSLDTTRPGDVGSNTSSGNSPSSAQSSPLRTPSPFGKATVSLSRPYGPFGNPFVQQAPDNTYASFSTAFNPDDPTDISLQSHMSNLEKDFRLQDPTDQIASVQSSHIWPWTEPAPLLDLDATLTDLNNTTDFSQGDHQYSFNADYYTEAGRATAAEGVQSARRVVDRLVQRGGSVTIDVEKLLERLVDGGACLGRAPGFRKELVDHALVLGLAEGF